LPGVKKIIVPSPQTIIEEGKDYIVKIICFNVTAQKAKIFWRPLGQKKYNQADLEKTSDTYWEAIIPADSIMDDFEYYLLIIEDEKQYLFPASARQINYAVTLLKNN